MAYRTHLQTGQQLLNANETGSLESDSERLGDET
jgi:hypothetical protein